MSTCTLTSNYLLYHKTSTSSSHNLSSHQLKFNPKKPRKPPILSTLKAALSDPFVLQIAETLEDSVTQSSIPLPLQKLRDLSSESLLSLSWPSKKDEPFRFTDISFIKSSEIQPITYDPSKDSSFSINLDDTQLFNLTIIDGFLVDSLSRLNNLPNGVYVGSLGKLNSEEILKRVSEFVANFEGDLFCSLNGVGAQDLVVIYVPEGCRVENPINLRYCSVKGSDVGSKTMPVSNPRVLVVVENGGEVSIVEEYVGGDDDKCYWSNSVIEVVIGENASVSHSYVQTQSLGAAHIKWTAIRQVNVGILELGLLFLPSMMVARSCEVTLAWEFVILHKFRMRRLIEYVDRLRYIVIISGLDLILSL